jgi:hypothetical protein
MKETIQFSQSQDGSYTVYGKTFRLACEGVDVVVDGKSLPLCFSHRHKDNHSIGSTSGILESGESQGQGMTVRMEFFQSDDRHMAAVRLAVRNDSGKTVKLDRMEVMRMTKQEHFIAGDSGIGQWKVLRFPFHKSDIPSYYRPTVPDKDFADAVFSCINAVPGKGVLYNSENIESCTVSSGPVMMVKNSARPELPILMLAATDIRSHYIQQLLTTTDDRSAFAEFKIVCDFLRVSLEPGAETATHWLLITTGAHESDLLGYYTETLAAIHHVPLPCKPSPTAYCTWYFYTFLISEHYVLEELASIKERKVPLDIFQIDDGWMDTYGTYEPHADKFPHGMAFIALQIQAAGMIPGIWAAPFVIDAKSPIVQRFPDIYQKDQDGQRIIYPTDRDCYILDPTAPEAMDYLRGLMHKLKGWGYRYFKLDWLRSIYEFKNAILHDPSVNCLTGYHMAMRVIRETLGSDAFILACGGLSDPAALGSVNATRTSKDVRGIWNGPEGMPKSGAMIQLKQNLFRSYVNRFYHGDPDATQIRVRKQRFSELETKCVGVYQSEGHYTDEEAFTICVHQFLCGGMITISERFPELQDERLALLRHISPAITRPARILDYDTPVCPTLFLNEIQTECRELGNYRLLTVGNWDDEPVTRRIRLKDLLKSLKWDSPQAVFEFRTQQFLGIFDPGDEFEIKLPPHSMRVMRLTPWLGKLPVILGTNLHITGGAAEIKELAIKSGLIQGNIVTRWHYPVVITAGFPDSNGITVKNARVQEGGGFFDIRP